MQELARGAGPSAGEGDTVLFDYTLRRADGYFVYVSFGGEGGVWDGGLALAWVGLWLWLGTRRLGLSLGLGLGAGTA